MSLPSLSKRCSQVSAFLIMDILEKAQKMQAQGIDVIHLEIGEPDFDTPQCIVQSAHKALDAGQTHYTSSQGIAPLQKAIAKRYKDQYNVTIEAEQVLIFPGTSPAMYLLFDALLDTGDRVIMSNPSYPCYQNAVRFAHGDVCAIPTREEDGFQLQTEDVHKNITANTKALLINSPSNPTGIVMEGERMQALAQLCDTHPVRPLIISDEIYHCLTYEGQDHCILEYTPNAIVIGGFSKAFAMTGWRLGYLIVPKQYIAPMVTLMQNFFLSTNSMSQYAGICALEEAHEHVQSMCAIYNERRLYVLEALRSLGFHIPVEPKGAFYVLFNARHLAEKFGGSSVILAFDILEKAHVGVTPGSEFGSQTEGFLRISYANSMENLKEAMERLRQYIHNF